MSSAPRVWWTIALVAGSAAFGPAPAGAAVEVQARFGRQVLTVGETTTLEVTIRGAVTGIREPQFDVPAGLQVLGTGRSQSFSAVNAKISVETVYRYELAPDQPGRYTVGPIRVRVGSQTYQSGVATVTVSAERTRLGRSGDGPASLVADVTPREPYVGQAVIMRVRLIQRAALAEDPRYDPPPTTGFWAERASEPESYYADQNRTRVLVTETRTRLYPLGSGVATIGQAAASLALASPWAATDPLRWLGGRPPRHEVVVHSAPVRVRVRPLPRGAPAGYGGAVGRFATAWSADRSRTTQDVPVTVRFEVRGLGNLPLIRTPAIRSRDFEVYASTVDDSLARPGSTSSGRRRFQWTVLALRQGRLELPAPEFSWFDPESRRYERASLSPIVLEVGPPLAAGAATPEIYPAAFGGHPLDPFHRPMRPWAYALAGLAIGAAFRWWRRASRPDAIAAERARQREWSQAVRLGKGPDFWSAADRACEWLAGHGRAVGGLRREIEASRYGGTRADPEVIRRRLLGELSKALPAEAPRWLPRLGAVAMVLLAVYLGVAFAPHGGDAGGIARARRADRLARAGDVAAARAEWTSLWRDGSRAPGLAARLAWSEMDAGAIGAASLWVLRGDRGEPRDPALSWVFGQVREAGGLSGFSPARVPVCPVEWAILALLAGMAVMLLWPRRLPAAAALLVLVLGAGVYPFQSWLSARASRGVVLEGVMLEGPNLELEPGQVVTVLERAAGRVRALAGRGVSGWLPRGSLGFLDGGR